MLLRELENYTGQLLSIDRFKDYAPNGIQVEGRPQLKRILGGVSASLALIDAAIAWQADAIIVHHGYFWRGEDPRIIGNKQRRIAKLLRADISLLAYHLPLDAHPELGNNVQLAHRLGINLTNEHFGEQDLGWLGELDCNLSQLGERCASALGRAPLLVGDASRPIQRVAWCSGGAQGMFEAAIAAGADCFITGEASEQNYHQALESGVAFIAAGHHATEQFGVQALLTHLAQQFDLEFAYHDLQNPL